MTLSFKRKFKNGEPTYFFQKIHTCLVDNKLINDIKYMGNHTHKIHTIREDKANRWHEGRDIHFVINNRTKDRFQFAPVVKCKSVQKIEIIYNRGGGVNVFINGEFFHYQTSWGREWSEVSKQNMQKLAVNDGFESIGDFFKYFNKDFTGKIIHWTDFKY